MNNMSQEINLPSGDGTNVDFLKVSHVKLTGELKVVLNNIRMVPTTDYGKSTKTDKVWIDVTGNSVTYAWIPNKTSLARLGQIFKTTKGSELEGKEVTLTVEKDATYKQEMVVPKID